MSKKSLQSATSEASQGEDIYSVRKHGSVSAKKSQTHLLTYPAEERLLHVALFHELPQEGLAGRIVQERLHLAVLRSYVENDGAPVEGLSLGELTGILRILTDVQLLLVLCLDLLRVGLWG